MRQIASDMSQYRVDRPATEDEIGAVDPRPRQPWPRTGARVEETLADPVPARLGDVPPAYQEGVATTRPMGGSRLAGGLLELAKTVILALVIFVVMQTFVVQTYQVEQRSMQPTLQPGQYLLVDKLTPRFDTYSRGDIVVFRPHGTSAEEVPFIKRVIGVPGDRVELREDAVFVNGVQLEEPYLPANEPTDPESDETSWLVPSGQLFVMGDHRTASQDSRSSAVGLVGVDSVIGRAWLRFWPINTLGIVQTPTYENVPQAATAN